MKERFKTLQDFLNKWEWLILLLGLVVLLRIPSLFEPHHYGDEEIYFVMGRAWREGVPLYSGAFDHKPPMIYILAGIAQTVFVFRFILMLWMLVHTVLVWLVANNLWGKKRQWMPFITTLIFVLLSSLPAIEGNIANAELFMMMPMTAALYLLLTAERKQVIKYLFAGVLAGFGFLFKVPVIFDFIAMALYFWVFSKKNLKKSLLGIFDKNLWIMVFGFLVPISVTTAYYYWIGSGSEYLRAALTINLGYVSSWSTSSYSFNPFKSGLFVRGLILAGYTLLLFTMRNKLDKKFVLSALWLGFSVFGALLSGRPYPHYLLQPVTAAALLIPVMFEVKSKREWSCFGGIVAIGALIQVSVGFWSYPTIPYYKTFVEGVTGQISGVEYVSRFSESKRNFVLAKYLNERLAEGEKIYVWGSDASLYNLTDRLPAGGKYIVNFHVRDFDAYDEVMSELKKNTPRYVVVMPDPMEFEEMFKWLNKYYVPTIEIDRAVVYYRF